MILKSSDELFFIQLNLKKEQYSLSGIINGEKFLETTTTFALLDKEFIDFFISFRLSITDII